jgi:K+ transporter
MGVMMEAGYTGHQSHWDLADWSDTPALGVVYGDIGTSPLYSLKEAAKAASPVETLAPDAVLGVVSLILWALILIISIRCALLILRADKQGEGGIRLYADWARAWMEQDFTARSAARGACGVPSDAKRLYTREAASFPVRPRLVSTGLFRRHPPYSR